MHERSVRVPHISVYRNGDAALIQHMRIAAQVVDAHLNHQLVFPFREGRSRVFFPFCTVVFYPFTRSRGEICGTAFRNGKGRKLLRAVQYFEAGDTLLLLFNQNSPSHSGGEIVAGNPLHRNVVFDHIDLLCGRNPIQTINSFHFLCLLSPDLSGTGISVPISIMPFARFDKCADGFSECSCKRLDKTDFV